MGCVVRVPGGRFLVLLVGQMKTKLALVAAAVAAYLIWQRSRCSCNQKTT